MTKYKNKMMRPCCLCTIGLLFLATVTFNLTASFLLIHLLNGDILQDNSASTLSPLTSLDNLISFNEITARLLKSPETATELKILGQNGIDVRTSGSQLSLNKDGVNINANYLSFKNGEDEIFYVDRNQLRLKSQRVSVKGTLDAVEGIVAHEIASKADDDLRIYSPIGKIEYFGRGLSFKSTMGNILLGQGKNVSIKASEKVMLKGKQIVLANLRISELLSDEDDEDETTEYKDEIEELDSNAYELCIHKNGTLFASKSCLKSRQ